ncbi:MAG: hypothetical protein WC806_06195 [Candidatus Gracilibacteria bacterium]|jgi:hypothetical protein
MRKQTKILLGVLVVVVIAGVSLFTANGGLGKGMLRIAKPGQVNRLQVQKQAEPTPPAQEEQTAPEEQSAPEQPAQEEQTAPEEQSAPEAETPSASDQGQVPFLCPQSEIIYESNGHNENSALKKFSDLKALVDNNCSFGIKMRSDLTGQEAYSRDCKGNVTWSMVGGNIHIQCKKGNLNFVLIEPGEARIFESVPGEYDINNYGYEDDHWTVFSE